jgi:cardiolipin synthase A/B
MIRILKERTKVLLIIFGALVLLFSIATLFTSLTEEALTVTSTEPAMLGTPEFRAAIESIAGAPAQRISGEVELFNDGSLFLEDLLKEIGAAEHSITITNYIFAEGVMTDSTFDALIKKAKEGVKVRLILDAHGALKSPEEKTEQLEEAGGKVETFRPFSFRTIARAFRRTHVRAIVIDGRIGYTGGLAFEDTWLGNGRSEKQWRDVMFKYRGELAKSTQNHFNSLWRQTNGEILTGPDFYPAPMNLTVSSTSYFISLLHTPAPDMSADLLDLIWLTISGAKDHIRLATPYLTPPKEIVEALTDAVERGVKVELLVPGPYTDSKLVQSATRSYYEDLLKAGVRIYEYQPGMFHGKWLTADGRWSLIGSPNMDNRSAVLNVENIFGLEDERLAAALEKEFADNLSYSKEILADEFHPNIFKRVYYRATALFARQL